MRLVTAVLAPQRFPAAQQALAGFGITGMTVSEVSGCGRQQGHTEVYRGAEIEVALVPKVRLEVLVEDADAADLVGVLVAAARTGAEGRIGDGKVWVAGVEEVVRVRTGERGAAAI